MLTEIKFDDIFDKSYISNYGFLGMKDAAQYLCDKTIDFIKHSRIKCIKCNNFTCYASEINCNYKYKFINYECLKCCVVYGLCLKCNKLTRDCPSCNETTELCFKCTDFSNNLIDINNAIYISNVELSILKEHHNSNDVTEINDNYEIVKKIKEYSFRDPYESDSDTFIKYKTPTYYFDKNIFEDLTGDCGGHKTFWKCKCCENMEITDK